MPDANAIDPLEVTTDDARLMLSIVDYSLASDLAPEDFKRYQKMRTILGTIEICGADYELKLVRKQNA